jgi:peptide deformylase
MIKEIVQDPHPALRNPAQEVDVEKITSPEIQELIQNMHDSLATQKDGVALAAPQIAVEKQIFIVAPFIFEAPEEEHLVYINPKILSSSKKASWKHEGCLSCRWKIGEVERNEEITIEAYDEFGNKFTNTADGLLAHIYQHETDHFNGILFIDKARKLRDMDQSEIDEING